MRFILKITLSIFIIFFTGGMAEGIISTGRISTLGMLPLILMIIGIYLVWKYIPTDSNLKNIKGTFDKFIYYNKGTIPTYKDELYEATKRLQEWKSDIPAIIIVATDLIYKNDYKWACEFLQTGDNYNNNVFALKCLLGYCYIKINEEDKAYSCVLSIGEIIENKKISNKQVFELYRIVGKILPESLSDFANLAEYHSNKTLAQKLKILSMSLERH